MDKAANAKMHVLDMITLDCNKGDRIFVETGSKEGAVKGGYDRTAFLGFLIHRYD